MLARNNTENAHDFEGKFINHIQFHIHSRSLLKRQRFTRHLAYSVSDSVVPINSRLLVIKLYYSARTTLDYKDTEYSVPFMTS